MNRKESPGSVLIVAGLLCSLVTVHALGCHREVAPTSTPSDLPANRRSAAWSLNGIKIGQTLQEMEQILGKPEPIGSGTNQSFRWRQPAEVNVTVDGQIRAYEALGTRVTADGTELINKEFSVEEVRAALGKGRTEKHFRPKGSGVIATGRQYTGMSLFYENGNALFEIGFSATDGINYIRMTALGERRR